MAAFDAAGGAAAEGAPSTGAWLRGRCRIHPGAAREQVLVARQLAEPLRLTAAGLREGSIGARHAMVIAAACRELPAGLVTEAEAVLVEAAGRLDPAGLSRVAAHLRYVLDPDGALAASERGHGRRRLSISSTFGGLIVLDGLFDPEGGETLLAALDPLTRPAGSDDHRSPAQRRADGLVELARRALDTCRLPTVAGTRPQLNVITPAAVLRAEPGAGPATLSWTGPVPPDTVRRLGCDAVLTPVSLDPAGRPLNVGRTTRVIPPPCAPR